MLKSETKAWTTLSLRRRKIRTELRNLYQGPKPLIRIKAKISKNFGYEALLS